MQSARIRTLPKTTQAAACVFALLVLNYVVFRSQYHGNAIFPWDFLGGYHFQSYGWWYEPEHFFGPSAWFPWGAMGFPSALAIQAGGWYLPVGVLSGLGVAYTLNVAAMLQSAHVFAGAVGCYFLLRRLNVAPMIALVGAIGFHFCAAFYGNQQHVDIVRAYALFPWLLWCLHPATLRRSVWAAALGALVLFQFLVGAYPGNIVAAVYACAGWFAIMLFTQKTSQERRTYFVATAVVVVAAVALAGLKWLPFAASPELLETDASGPLMPSGPGYLLTLVLPYARDWFAADLTMRSFYLPLAAWAGLIFTRRLDSLVKAGLLFVVMALICGVVLPTLSPADRFLPGLNLSRFPLSDWRMVLSLGLIMLSCSGWGSLLREHISPPETLLRLVVAVMLGWGGAQYAKHIGYTLDDLKQVLPQVLVLIGLALFLAARKALGKRTCTKVVFTLAALVLASSAVIGGLQYHRAQSAPWVLPWSEETETGYFGAPVATLQAGAQQRYATQRTETRRPKRYVIGDDPLDVVRHRLDIKYNRCWYERSYCLLGYNNLKYSRPHNAIQQGLSDPDAGGALLAYMRMPSHLLISADPGLPIDVKKFSLTAGNSSGDVVGSKVQPLSFSPDIVQYRISVPADVRVVENEMWWKGWTYQACSTNGKNCLPIQPAEHTEHYLRTWTLPAGDWVVNMKFTQPGATASKILALLGLLLLGLYTLALKRRNAGLRPGAQPDDGQLPTSYET